MSTPQRDAARYEAAWLSARRRAKAERQRAQRLVALLAEPTPHIWAGLCPDATEGWDSRDPECPACLELVAALEVAR